MTVFHGGGRGVYFPPLLFSCLQMIPPALGPCVEGVCGAELRRSLLLQGGEGSSEQEAAAE